MVVQFSSASILGTYGQRKDRGRAKLVILRNYWALGADFLHSDGRVKDFSYFNDRILKRVGADIQSNMDRLYTLICLFRPGCRPFNTNDLNKVEMTGHLKRNISELYQRKKVSQQS